MPLKVGTKAPDFTLKTKTGQGLKDVTLSQVYSKGTTVLLFFPGAFTTPCTKEMCDVSKQGLHDFGDADVIGVSVDSPFAQEAWAKMNHITATLLSDYKREVIKLYDVVLPDLAGLGPSAARAVFVIDKEGVIRYREQTPSPTEFPNFKAIRDMVSSLSG